MSNIPPPNLFKKQPVPGNTILETAMNQQIHRQPNMPTQIDRPMYKPLPPGVKIPQQYLNMKKPNQPSIHNSSNSSQQSYPMPPNFQKKTQDITKSFKMGQNLNQMSSTNNFSDTKSEIWSNSGSIQSKKNPPNQTLKSGQSYQPHGGQISHQNQQKQYSKTQFPETSFQNSEMSIPRDLNIPPSQSSSQQGYSTILNNQKFVQKYSTASQNQKFDSFYLLLSNFPLITPKDQIYLPVINRLENAETKKCFQELYINLKFLVIQPNEQFWKYLEHLNSISFNGLSEQEVAEGNKLRLALESCLTNFSVKEFNKCVTSDDVIFSSSNVSKKIYQYESIFDSKSYQLYDSLVDTVFQFYERIMKSQSQSQIDIIVSSWYIDTIKAIEISLIYGNKQPDKVKKLIKSMFNLRPALFTQDFANFIKCLQKYIESSSGINRDDDQVSLLESLTKKIDPKSSKFSNTKKTFGNFEKYCIRQIFYMCSECLKLFMIVTNIFKLFPSNIKLMVMENGDFIRTVIKIAVRVMYNLREQEIEKNRRWKIPKKLKGWLKNMEFILMDKITEMFKFIFMITKNALDQEVDQDLMNEKKSKQDLRYLKIKIRFYKRLIEGTVNKKKDKDKQQENKPQQEQKQEDNSEEEIEKKKAAKEQNQKKQVTKPIKKKSSPKSDIYNDVDFLSEDSLDESDEKVQSVRSDIKESEEQKAQQRQIQEEKQQMEQKNIKGQKLSAEKQVIPQNEYGRVLLKYLLRKELKKDYKKHQSTPYFYTEKIYNYCKQEYEAYLEEQHNSSSESIQHTSSFESLFIFLKVLQDFENSVRKEYAEEVKFNEKYRKVDLVMKQLPSLSEFRERQERIHLKELMKKLNQKNREYEDEPNEQEEIQIYWDNQLQEQDFTNLQEEFNQTTESINFNKKPDVPKNTQNESQQLSPEEILEQEDNAFNVRSITSFNSSIFKPHESLQKVTQSMIKEELQTFEKFKNLNWHEISRVSFIKEEKGSSKKSQQKEHPLLKYNNQAKMADIGLSFDMELAIEDEEDENPNLSKLSHFYYMDKKKKSFMEDYSFDQSQSIAGQEQNLEEEEDEMEEEEHPSRQRREYKFKKSVKIKYVPKVEQESEPIKKHSVPPAQPIQNKQNISVNFSKRNYGQVNPGNKSYGFQNYPYPLQQYPQQYPPELYPSMHNQMIPPIHSTMYGRIPMSYPPNYVQMAPQMANQMAPMYTPILPANISALNLSHHQNSVNLNHSSSSDASYQSFKYSSGPKNNVLNRTGGSYK